MKQNSLLSLWWSGHAVRVVLVFNKPKIFGGSGGDLFHVEKKESRESFRKREELRERKERRERVPEKWGWPHVAHLIATCVSNGNLTKMPLMFKTSLNFCYNSKSHSVCIHAFISTSTI